MSACFDCGHRPTPPGKWRCAECQARVDVQRAAAFLAGKPKPSKLRRQLSPLDTFDGDDDRADAGWLPYRD